jgi:hypothetical protein
MKKELCYVIMNNAGHSWLALTAEDAAAPKDGSMPVLPQMLADGWEPIRETPMGGGTSGLAHSLILLERKATKIRAPRTAKKV